MIFGSFPVHFRCHFYFRLLYTGWDGIFSVCVSFKPRVKECTVDTLSAPFDLEECKNARSKVRHEISRIHSSVLKIIRSEIWRLILIGQHLLTLRSLVPITNHVACPYLVLESFVFLVPDWLISFS